MRAMSSMLYLHALHYMHDRMAHRRFRAQGRPPQTVYTFFQGPHSNWIGIANPSADKGIMQWRGPRLEPNPAKGEGRWLPGARGNG